MTLITKDGRFDRAAVVARAKLRNLRVNNWTIAMREAYAEATAEQRRFKDSQTNKRCSALAATADRLMERENAR